MCAAASDVVVNVNPPSTARCSIRCSPAGDPPIALKWTLYDPSLNSLPLYEMNVAANWQEFSAALAQWCWPTQNLVYADDQGHIAYHAIGKVPIRRGGAGLFDVPLPHDTNDPGAEWGCSPETNTGHIHLQLKFAPLRRRVSLSTESGTVTLL